MERETGLEPATSSLGNCLSIENEESSVYGRDLGRWQLLSFQRLAPGPRLMEPEWSHGLPLFGFPPVARDSPDLASGRWAEFRLQSEAQLPPCFRDRRLWKHSRSGFAFEASRRDAYRASIGHQAGSARLANRWIPNDGNG